MSCMALSRVEVFSESGNDILGKEREEEEREEEKVRSLQAQTRVETF